MRKSLLIAALALSLHAMPHGAAAVTVIVPARPPAARIAPVPRPNAAQGSPAVEPHSLVPWWMFWAHGRASTCTGQRDRDQCRK